MSEQCNQVNGGYTLEDYTIVLLLIIVGLIMIVL